MLFDDVMHEQAAALRRFYADPTCSVMVLRVDPDLEYPAAKFLAQLGCDDGEESDESDAPLVFGISADFVDEAAFYREAEAQIVDALAPVREAYAAEDPDLVLPAGIVRDRAWPPRCSIEARFAEYLELVARGLGNWHETVVFVVRFDALDVERARLSLARLAANLMGPGVKLVLFDERKAPRLADLRVMHTRWVAAPLHARQGDGQLRLAKLVASVEERVHGISLHARDLHGLWDGLRSVRDRGAPIVPLYAEAPFETRTQFCAEVLRALAKDDQHGAWDLRALDRPESTLVERIELGTARFGTLAPCIVVRPTAVKAIGEWTRFVRELVAACARVETKFVLLDVDGAAPLPDGAAVHAPLRVHDFDLGAQHTHHALEKVLTRPDLPVDVRLGHLVMLANVRVGQGRTAEAAELAAESIELASEHGLHARVSTSWWTLGYALQRAGELARARNAFCEATDAAMREADFAGAAQGLVGIGHTYFLENDWVAAVGAYRLAREHWLDAGHVFGECEALVWIGESMRKAKQYDEADAHFQHVVARYLAMRAPFEQMARGGLADVYERMAANHREAGRRASAEACRRLAHEHGSHGAVPDRPV